MQPSEQAWDHHREELERLYMDENKSVQYIKRYMEEKYHFAASKYQFDKRFNKWNCSKYSSSLVWKAVLPHVRKLEQEGKGAAVFIDMKRKTREEIRNAMARYKGFLGDPDSADVPILPKNAIVHPVIQPITVLITQRLPFYFMERQLARNLPSPSADFHSTAIIAASNVIGCNTPLERILSAVAPPEQHELVDFNLPIKSDGNKLFNSPLHRALVYSITNNLAGLNGVSYGDIISFLKHETTYKLFLALSSAPDLYSFQALTWRIFWLALNSGDAEAVSFILKHSPDMDVNGDIPGRMGIVWSMLFDEKPIEVASALGHVEVVKALIAAGAKVEGTDALNMLMYHAPNGISITRSRQVSELLVNSTSALSAYHLHHLIRHQNSNMIHELIMKHLRSKYHSWAEDGVLLATLQSQPIHTCYEALKTLRERGVDLNVPIGSEEKCSILEVLSRRFEAKTLHHLLESFPQFRVTEEVVIKVIRHSRDERLIKYALINGPNDYANNDYRDYLIGYAIMTDTSTIMTVLEFLTSCPTGNIQDLRESLIVAALMGNIERIQDLLTNALTIYGTRFSDLSQGYEWLIYRTIKAGHPEAALFMLEAGVIIRHDEYCLEEAMRIKHATLLERS
ncbi:hypothetical protein PG995_002881 [Apiospora arundinis]